MKKLILWAALFAFGSSTLFAQTPAAQPSMAPSKAKTEVSKAKPAVEQAAKPAPAAAAVAGDKQMKKDGTPDKRYKANKHVKKDGTPDKRFSEHKTPDTKAPATK